jgi:cardiolipin synthase
MNLAHQYMGPRKTEDRWHDISMRITGPAAGQAFEIFRSDWEFAASENLEPLALPIPKEDITATIALQFVASGPDVENDALREALMISLFRAHQRVWIVTPYFVPDDLLLEGLCMAAQRGVDLRLITPERSNHRLADWAREGYLSQLQDAGAQIHFYKPRMLHAKALLIDESVAVIGSANMDMRSLLLNYEVGLCIYSLDVIRQLEEWMQGLMRACSERQPHHSATLTMIEGISRLFAPLL